MSVLRWSEEEYRAHLARQADVQRFREGQMAQEPPVNEKVFLAAVLRVAHDHHWLAYHTYRSSKSAEGFPDLVLAPGPTIAGKGHPLYLVELKTETGIVSEAQHAWLDALAGCTGVVAEVWKPRDLQDIVERLRG